MSIVWYVAVTTAPRKDPTLNTCISSLRDCGWEPTVFAEPGSLQTNAYTVNNEVQLGTWHNWLKSVRAALESDAKVIMTVQDDTEFHPDSKDFAESVLWPADDCGFLSLYTPKQYSVRTEELKRKLRKQHKEEITDMRPVGINRIYTRSLWGACALVWPRHVLETIMTSKLIEAWKGAAPKSRNPAVIQKRIDNPHLIANSDTAIGKLMNQYNYTMWFVDPSPVAHIAKYSAIGHGDNSGRRNAYRIADHSLPLTYQVFPK